MQTSGLHHIKTSEEDNYKDRHGIRLSIHSSWMRINQDLVFSLRVEKASVFMDYQVKQGDGSCLRIQSLKIQSPG